MEYNQRKEGDLMKILALDLGYGWTKAKLDKKVWRQPSVVGSPRALFDESKKPGDLIYNGKEGKYFIGDLALRQSDVKYKSVKDNKADTWTTAVLAKTAIACLAPRETVNLVTGLPIDYYFTQKDDFDAFFKQLNQEDYYEVETTGELKQLARPTIQRIKIVPQPLGSVMAYLLDDSGNLYRSSEAKKRILVVDLGYFTLDLLILDAMEINKASSSPPGLGVDTAYKLLQDLLKEHIGKAPARHDIDRIAIAGTYEGYDIRPLISTAFRTLSNQIQLEIDGLNMVFDTVILTGGAVSFIDEHLDLNNKIVLGQLGNVEGYEKMGKRLWLGNR